MEGPLSMEHIGADGLEMGSADGSRGSGGESAAYIVHLPSRFACDLCLHHFLVLMMGIEPSA